MTTRRKFMQQLASIAAAVGIGAEVANASDEPSARYSFGTADLRDIYASADDGSHMITSGYIQVGETTQRATITEVSITSSLSGYYKLSLIDGDYYIPVYHND